MNCVKSSLEEAVFAYKLDSHKWEYQDKEGNEVNPLTDANANAPGFQLDLNVGENELAIHVFSEKTRDNKLYGLTIIRDANSVATGSPTISGTAQVGETLTADTSGIADADGLSSATFGYQWVRSAGTTDTDIAGATGTTYALVSADEGKTVKVRVTFTDDAGNEETLNSAATAAVAAAPANQNPGQQGEGEQPREASPTVSLSLSPPHDGGGYSN